MRGLFLLLLGIASGIVGAVLIFTLLRTFDADDPPALGGGNARIELDEPALVELMRAQVAMLLDPEEPLRVQVVVGDDGLLLVTISVGLVAAERVTELTLDPEPVEGALDMVLIYAQIEGFEMSPEELATIVVAPLYAQLEALAGGLEYRLTAITTREGRLTLEILI